MTLSALENTKRFDKGFRARVSEMPYFFRKIVLGTSGLLDLNPVLVNFLKKCGRGFSKTHIPGFSIRLTVLVLSGEFPESPERLFLAKARSVFAQFPTLLIKNDLEVLQLYRRIFRKTPTNNTNQKSRHSRQNTNVTLGRS